MKDSPESRGDRDLLRWIGSVPSDVPPMPALRLPRRPVRPDRSLGWGVALGVAASGAVAALWPARAIVGDAVAVTVGWAAAHPETLAMLATVVSLAIGVTAAGVAPHLARHPLWADARRP